MFHPSNKPKTVWNVIMGILLVYTATVMPYKISFVVSKVGDPWFYLEIIIDILFFLDVIVNIFSAYVDHEGAIIKNRKMIFLRYLRTWMIPDIIACFPFDLVIDSGEEEASSSGGYNNLIRLVRLPRLYRIFRVSRVLKMIKKLSSSDNEFMDKL
jgi:hypothetical protein